MTFLFALPGLLLSAWIRCFDSPLHWFSVSLLLFSLIQFSDVRFHISRPDHLHQRAEFFYWLYRESRAGFGAGVCLGLLIIMGGLQWWLMYASGDPRSVFEAYGLFYGKVVEGEVWRLLTGPYLHYSEAHIALNGVLFVLLGGLAWALKGSVSILFFAAACSVSLTAQMLFGGDLFDNAGGISGGVYALAGLVLGGTLAPAGRLPPGLAPQIFVIVVLSTLLAELESEAAGTVAHFTGLAFGMLIGSALSLPQRFRQRLAVSQTTTGASIDTGIKQS